MTEPTEVAALTKSMPKAMTKPITKATGTGWPGTRGPIGTGSANARRRESPVGWPDPHVSRETVLTPAAGPEASDSGGGLSRAGADAPPDDEPQRRMRAALNEIEIDAAVDVSRETADPGPEPGGGAQLPPIAAEAVRAVTVLDPAGTNAFPRPPRCRVMCVANQKGGVGKTTTAVNIAAALAMHGCRTLVIDLDPQGNASTGLGVPHHAGVPSVYNVLVEEVSLGDVVVPVSVIPQLWCAPATIDLAGAEIELVSMVARESRLARALEKYDAELDYVLIDCPPSLGLLTVNALVAADEVLIPIQCEYYALEGLGQLIHNVELVRRHLNRRLRVGTILLTMYDARTKLADQVAAEVREHFPELVLDTRVPRSVRVSEAPGYGQSVMTYDPGSRGAASYLQAAREIATRAAAAPAPTAGLDGGGSTQ